MKLRTYNRIVDGITYCFNNTFFWSVVQAIGYGLTYGAFGLWRLYSGEWLFESNYFPLLVSVPLTIMVIGIVDCVMWCEEHKVPGRYFWARWATKMEYESWRIRSKHDDQMNDARMDAWLEEHVTGLHWRRGSDLFFFKSSDAAFYKLTWG